MVALRDSYYFHMKPGSVKVKPGDRVKRGQLLSKSGNSVIRVGRIYTRLTDQADTFAQ